MIEFNKIDDFKMKQVWITSDTHFNNKNIIKRNNRNFKTIEDHDAELVDNINKYVPKGDLLIHLGDWSSGPEEYIEDYRERLNVETIFICLGENDHFIREDDVKYGNLFDHINDIMYLCVEDYKFMLCHYPMVSWHKQSEGVPMFFGHTQAKYDGRGRSIDVGVDSAYKILNCYRPFNLFELKAIMNREGITTVDNH